MSLKILLAPSETKKSGGDIAFSVENLLFSQLTQTRKELIENYDNIVTSFDEKQLSSFFGLKKQSDIAFYSQKISYSQGLKAIERYSGVAFDYLDYKRLNDEQKAHIDERVIIFSNIFGFLRADDIICDYRVKQGSDIGDFSPQKLYHSNAYLLDEYLQNDEILDLRAGYYDKFYKPNKRFTTLKFLKEGKVVSHWAKAYRGIISRMIALHKIDSIEALISLNIDGLSLIEIVEKKNIQEIVYEVETK
ncbi:MAG: YaaA family protein [Sulfurovum sp.]|nr:MAG: YaaA family protein [Sulfurovum sp.]